MPARNDPKGPKGLAENKWNVVAVLPPVPNMAPILGTNVGAGTNWELPHAVGILSWPYKAIFPPICTARYGLICLCLLSKPLHCYASHSLVPTHVLRCGMLKKITFPRFFSPKYITFSFHIWWHGNRQKDGTNTDNAKDQYKQHCLYQAFLTW